MAPGGPGGSPHATSPTPCAPGAVVPGLLFTAGTADAACYPADGGFGLLVSDRSPTSRVALIDGGELFTNEHLAENGNAALAIGLMGRHPTRRLVRPGARGQRPRGHAPRASAS